MARNNPHIGRDMAYPYEAQPPKRQIAIIFDLNKCIACQTCSVACKMAWTSGKGQEHIFYNNVETKPYGGYPVGWDLKLLERVGPARWEGNQLTSKTIFEGDDPLETVVGHRPAMTDYASPNLGEDEVAGQLEQGAHFTSAVHPLWMFYLARVCNHCDNPACLASCPRKAIYKREEDGIVLIDQKRCRGYQECVRACPYKKTFFNAVSRVSEKCIGCYPRLEQGEVPLCVESCIGKIRLHGFLSTTGPREDNPLDYIVRIRKLALPLYPQFGTGPNMYYIPPLNVPEQFLTQTFGPGVAEAHKTYRGLKDDKLLLGAMMLFGASQRIITRFKVEGKTVIGWDVEGREVARVPFTEPVYIRDHYDERFTVYRHNTP